MTLNRELLNKYSLATFKSLESLFHFASADSSSELGKLNWLVRLRWMVIGLLFLLIFPGLMLGPIGRSVLPAYIGLVSLLLVFNLLTQLLFVEAKRPVNQLMIFFQLFVDLVIITIILILTGGVSNPFWMMLLLNSAIGGLLLKDRTSVSFIILAMAALGYLQVRYFESRPLVSDNQFFMGVLLSHALILCFWMVMSSLRRYLDDSHEKQLSARIGIERQDRLRAVGALAAGFSHEFASPLGAAKIHLDRILRSLDKSSEDCDNLKEDALEAMSSIQACELVIKQMNSSQFDSRATDSRLVNMKELAQDILDSWKDEHPDARMNICIEMHHLKIPVLGFAQVLLNLLDNAYEASPGAEMTVTFVVDQGRFVFGVEDQGKGFDDVVLAKLGEPFLTTKAQGTGLGLYVSQLFVQSLGGKLVVKSSGQGAAVRLEWPVNSEWRNEK